MLFRSVDGAIGFDVPSAANFTLQAQTFGGTVDLGATPSVCTTAQTSESSKSMTCNSGGRNYVLIAGEDSTYTGAVHITYH